MISLSGINALKSSLSVTVKKAATGDGLVDIGAVQGTGLKSFSAASSDLVGSGINLTDLLGSLKIHDVVNGAGITAQGTAAQKTVITAHVIEDGTAIDLGSSITSLTAARFGHGSLTAPSLGTLLIKGDKAQGIAADFAANVTLSGAGVAAGKAALNSVLIAGTVEGATFDVAGNVKSFQAGAFVNSRLYLGFVSDDAGNPMAGGTFSASFTLGSFKVTGVAGAATAGFVNSVVAAQTVTSVSLKSAQTDNGANGNQAFGVLGHTVRTVTIQSQAFTWNKTHHVPEIDDFLVTIV